MNMGSAAGLLENSGAHDERLNVLLIEDQPFDAQLVKAWLQKGGGAKAYRLRTAATLAEAIEALDLERFDAILLDLWLPDSLGLDTLHAVRARAAHLPIVILSGASDEELSVQAVKAGAQDYIVKGSSDGDTIRRAVRYAVERHRMEGQRRLAEVVFNCADSGIMVTDSQGCIIRVNPAFSRLTGYQPEEVIGRRPAVLSPSVHGEDFYAAMWSRLTREGSWEGEIWNRRKSGEVFPEWLRINATRADDGMATGYVAIFSDISLRKRVEEELVHQATRDALTGLPNRLLALRELSDMLERADEGHRVAVLFVDLDGFKAVNDTHGHAVGDRVLKEVALRLRGAVRASDEVARFGGDEFLVLLPGVTDENDAAYVARKLLLSLSAQFETAGDRARISASIGIALCPGDATSPETLIQAADDAMFAVKHAGKQDYRFYHDLERFPSD